MLARTAPLEVVRVENSIRDDDTPMTRKDGTPVQSVHFTGADRYRQDSVQLWLAAGVTLGELAKPGTKVCCDLELREEAVSFKNTDRVSYKVKMLIVAVHAATSSAFGNLQAARAA